jgi:hypothetical protein
MKGFRLARTLPPEAEQVAGHPQLLGTPISTTIFQPPSVWRFQMVT